jgi:hypothetical protein
LQFLAFLGVDGLVLECDLGVRVDGYALEGLPPQQGLQRLLLHYLKWEKGTAGGKGWWMGREGEPGIGEDAGLFMGSFGGNIGFWVCFKPPPK